MSHAPELRYRSVSELCTKARVNYKGIKPQYVYKRLHTMRQLAESARKKGDDETDYIMLKRWLDAVDWLKRTQEYKNDKSMFSINEINEAKTYLADLHKKLDAKYKNGRERISGKSATGEPMDVDIDPKIKRNSYIPAVDGPISLPETPTKDPLTDSDEFMTCEHLFQIIQKVDSRCLIIDIRPKTQFESSRMSSKNCINIPQSEIRPGVMGFHFEKYLYNDKDKTPYRLYRHRGPQYNDVIVLIDSNATSSTLTPKSHLNILKRILEEYDPGIQYKKIVFLEGGYREWLTRYPTLTTNPKVSASPSRNLGEKAPMEILDETEYPEWLHSDDEDGDAKMHERNLPDLKAINKSEAVPKSSFSRAISLPEAPTKDPLTDKEIFMTCEQLFHIIQKVDSKCLIIDIRPKTQFESSRISSENCINIPQSEIRPGVMGSHFERYLFNDKDKTPYRLFRHRGPQYTDVIVVIDSNATSSTLTPASHLNIFKQILEEWDPGIQYKKIVFLEGGYMEWLTRYPTFTTNPNVPESPPRNLGEKAPIESLDDIEYPEWLHSDDEDGGIKMRDRNLPDLKPINKSEAIPKPTFSRDKIRTRQSLPGMNNSSLSRPVATFTNTIVPEPMEVDADDISVNVQQKDSTKGQQKRSQSLVKPNDVLSRPTVDRSSKPLPVKNLDAEMVLKLLKELIDLAKSKEKLEQKISEEEQSSYSYNLGQKDSKEEEYIRVNLKSLHRKLEEVNEAYTNVEKDLEKYNKDTVTAKFIAEEKREKNDLDFNLGLIKRRIKNIVHERKEMKIKSIQSEQKSEPKETKENGTDIHREPLKNDATPATPGGLERSYSSPNLLQERHKAPRVDRTSKPQVPLHNRKETNGNENIKISHVSWANREERMAPVHGSVHPGITGLKNLGNSCYMNSIIQCLSNTTRLAKYFTDNLYIDDINTGNESTTQGQVVEEVAQVIKALWRGQYKSISPHDLKVAVGQYKLQFDSYEQQDSHEFLTFLLDWMHNDLKKLDKISHEMTVAEKAWDKAMSSERSIISDLFFGQLRSTITCSTCKQSSTTYETFNSLTTSLPHSSRCTLNDCILKFVTGQKVCGWKCPKCQLPRVATKKFDFVKLAPIIVIHLNRFAESGGWLEKRNSAVEFPLTAFNLKPYVVSDQDTSTYSNHQSYNYSLYGMSNHYGTMDGGHYTAFCKNAAQNKWYKYDDQTVTEVTASQVKSQTNTAYLLFYTSFI